MNSNSGSSSSVTTGMAATLSAAATRQVRLVVVVFFFLSCLAVQVLNALRDLTALPLAVKAVTSTVKRPLGRPRRLTGALSRAPRTTLTCLWLTKTTARTTVSPRTLGTRILKARRLAHLYEQLRKPRSFLTTAFLRPVTKILTFSVWLPGTSRSGSITAEKAPVFLLALRAVA